MRTLVLPIMWSTALALVSAAVLVVAGSSSGLGGFDELYTLPGCALRNDIRSAAAQGDSATVRRILSDRPDMLDCCDEDGWTPLHEAARGGYTKVIEVLLLRGADVNARNEDGQTPLHLAARSGEGAAAKLLIGARARVNARDRTGCTPLDVAVRWGWGSVSELLQRHGGHRSVTAPEYGKRRG